jgi:hypothetical protein
MKTIVRFLLIVCLSSPIFSAKGQVILGIDTLLNWPDTAISGQAYFPTAIVSNTGPTPYQGTIQVAFQTQNTSGFVGLLYFNSNPIFLPPNDTAWLTPQNGLTFDSLFFRPGNNVVVVWPIASALADIDTFNTSVFVVTTNSLTELEKESILLAPVPAREYLHLKIKQNNPIERVRIFDVSGREIILSSTSESNDTRDFFLGNLPAGTYLIEVRFLNGTIARNRFIHVH